MITYQAKEQDLKNLIHLLHYAKGADHIALIFPKIQMDLRKYLTKQRDPEILPAILIQIIDGIDQLHKLGFTHRDLKPENIVLNLDPLEVRLIDFNSSFPSTQISKGSRRGTKGYHPDHSFWNDGSQQWDLYALGAMILECDLKWGALDEIRS